MINHVSRIRDIPYTQTTQERTGSSASKTSSSSKKAALSALSKSHKKEEAAPPLQRKSVRKRHTDTATPLPTRQRSKRFVEKSPVKEEGDINFMATDVPHSIKETIIQAISDAKKSVTIVVFSLASKEIMKALSAAADRKVKTTVVYDASQKCGKELDAGKNIHFYPIKHEESDVLMHHKLLAIDGREVMILTGNLVQTAFKSQGNFAVHLSCKKLAEKVERIARWLINDQIPSKIPFEIGLKETTLTFYSGWKQTLKAHDDILDRIARARKRVFVAMYTFTHKAYAEALVAAWDKGLDVRVVLDKMSTGINGAINLFRKRSFPCRQRDKGILHYKVAIIDNTLIMGSLNWSKAAFSGNDETLCIFDPIPSRLSRWVNTWWSSVEDKSTKCKKS